GHRLYRPQSAYILDNEDRTTSQEHGNPTTPRRSTGSRLLQAIKPCSTIPGSETEHNQPASHGDHRHLRIDHNGEVSTELYGHPQGPIGSPATWRHAVVTAVVNLFYRGVASVA